MIKPKLWVAVLLISGIALSPLMPTQAASSDSNASVSFATDHALNPADPNLPLTDDSRVNLPDTSSKEKQVVVNTTPEKTKKAVTASSTETSRSKLADTSATRKTLPQTGTVEMSGITVVSVILMSLAMVAGVFKKSRLTN